MISLQLAALVAATHTASQLDPINRTLWTAYGEGRLSDDEAQGLAELVLERSRAFTERRAYRPKADTGPNRNRTLSLFSTGHRQPRSPDRRRSLLRRQDMVRGNPLPASLSHLLTECERAVAEVIARRHIGWGFCDLCLGEIATLAGVSVRTAQRALRQLEALGWVTITERARFRQPSLTNVVRIISVEWTAWLAKRPKGVRSSKGGRVTSWQATSDKQAPEEEQRGRAGPVRGVRRPDPPPERSRGRD